jgi:transaldolase
MAIFIDTADLAQIKKWATLPFVKGVTTTPLVLQAANITDRFSRLRAIHELLRADQKLMIQAVGNDAVEILKDAHRIHENFPSAIVKIPTTWEGLSIAAPLQDAKMLLCYTMIFSAADNTLL